MRIQRTNRIDRGLILMHTHDDRKEDQCLHMIRTVQHLIERCLLFRMDLRGCVETLAKRANIDPVLTIAGFTSLLFLSFALISLYYHASLQSLIYTCR
jgi:uncharacterized protein (TIGR01589 family)